MDMENKSLVSPLVIHSPIATYPKPDSHPYPQNWAACCSTAHRLRMSELPDLQYTNIVTCNMAPSSFVYLRPTSNARHGRQWDLVAHFFFHLLQHIK